MRTGRAPSLPKPPSNARAPPFPGSLRPRSSTRCWRTGRRTALFFADELGGEPATDAFRAHTGPAALLVGPEGGFDDAEREAIRAHPQARAITLGPRILRGETAAIAATALWMGVTGDWNK